MDSSGTSPGLQEDQMEPLEVLSSPHNSGKKNEGENLPHLCSFTCSVSSHGHGSHSDCLGPHTPSCDSFSSSPAHTIQSLMPLPSTDRGERRKGEGEDRERKERREAAISPMTSCSCHTVRTSSILDNGYPRPVPSDWERAQLGTPGGMTPNSKPPVALQSERTTVLHLTGNLFYKQVQQLTPAILLAFSWVSALSPA